MRSNLGFAERAIARALHIPQGDFRNWAEIRRWAAGIAGQLSSAIPWETR